MKSPSSQSSRAINLLLLVVMVQWAIRHLLALLPDQSADLAWYAVDVLRAVGMSAAFAICATLIPWRSLRLKCLFAALCGYYISDTLVCLGWYAFDWPDPVWTAIIQGAGFTAAGAIYALRSYSQASDEICDGRIFCVRRIPVRLQDFLISLSCMHGPNGGYSLYANGYLYKYSNGRLVRRKVSSVPSIGYHICRGSKIDESVMSELDSLVGAEWSWRKNCLTVLAPIWRRHSG